MSSRCLGGGALVWLLALSGCALRNITELFLVGGHPEITENIPYGPGARQRLDIYRPSWTGEVAPVVVFLYGGRWQHGSRRDYRVLGDALAGRGFVAVVPDYRLYPEVRFPAWVEDAASAIGWVSRNIQQFGGDSTRIFVVGHSSSAHTAAVLALDDDHLRRAGVSPGSVRGFVSLAGPVAIEWTDADVQALMGPRDRWPRTYPMELDPRPAAPLLLLHGARDRTVAVANSVRLADRIRKHGGCARLITYKELGHVGIVLALALPQFDIAPVLEDLVTFLRAPAAACPQIRPSFNRLGVDEKDRHEAKPAGSSAGFTFRLPRIIAAIRRR